MKKQKIVLKNHTKSFSNATGNTRFFIGEKVRSEHENRRKTNVKRMKEKHIYYNLKQPTFEI